MPANAQPQTLTVLSGKEQVALKNVLFGDEFLLARQTSVPNAACGTAVARHLAGVRKHSEERGAGGSGVAGGALDFFEAAGLPAISFRAEKAGYHWFVTNKDNDLPVEYHPPAHEWAKNDVTLVNGQLKTHGCHSFTGWLGPPGVFTGPFGPNRGVREGA